MKAVNLIQNLLFPPKCANCGELLDVEVSSKLTDPLCPDCRLDFESEKERECNTCGLAMKFCRCMPRAMNRAQCTALLKLISYRNEDNSMSIRNFVYAIKHTYRPVNFSFVAENMRFCLNHNAYDRLRSALAHKYSAAVREKLLCVLQCFLHAVF